MAFTRRHFLSSLTAAVGATALPLDVGFAMNKPASPSGFQHFFSHPPDQAKPWVRWWWPGGAVTEEELRREIRVLRLAGFGGAEIQAFNPGIPNLSKDERARINDYANDAFFSHIRASADEADQNGLKIDVTFGSAWPSGGGFAITPELALVELTPAVTSVRAPLAAPIRVNIPAKLAPCLHWTRARKIHGRATGATASRPGRNWSPSSPSRARPRPWTTTRISARRSSRPPARRPP